MRIPVTRKDNRFMPDPRRVIVRYFDNGLDRTIALVEKVLAMTEKDANSALMNTLREFSRRHRNITTANRDPMRAGLFTGKIQIDNDIITI